MHSRRFRTALTVGILAVLYLVAGKLSLKLAFLHASASPVWPPAGIALAALLVLGYRAWPAIFIGAFLVNLTTAGNVPTSLGIATGNTLEAVVGAWLVHRFAGGAEVFNRAQGVFKFALAVIVSTLVSPTLGLTSLALAGFADWANYGAIWLTWWLGDMTGNLIVAPLIILWYGAPTRRWDRTAIAEVILLLLLLFVLGQMVFGGWLPISAKNYPIALICGAIVIWTAFRFTQRETATARLSWKRRINRFSSFKLPRPSSSSRRWRSLQPWRSDGARRRPSNNSAPQSRRRTGRRIIFSRCFRMNCERRLRRFSPRSTR